MVKLSISEGGGSRGEKLGSNKQVGGHMGQKYAIGIYYVPGTGSGCGQDGPSRGQILVEKIVSKF